MRFVSRILALILVSQLFFGCSDVTTELWIDKKGGGRMEIYLDLTTFLPESLLSDFNDSTNTNSEGDKFDSLLNSISSSGNEQYRDTTLTLYDILNLRDSLGLSEKEIHDLESITLDWNGDSVTRSVLVKLTFEFDNQQDFENLIDLTHNYGIKSDKQAQAILEFKREFMINVDAGIIRLPSITPPASLPDETPDQISMGLESMQGDDEETKQMRAMVEDGMGSIITIVHLPGNVEFSNDPDAVIDGKTVTFHRSILSAMLPLKNQASRVIKFKK